MEKYKTKNSRYTWMIAQRKYKKRNRIDDYLLDYLISNWATDADQTH